MTEDKFGEQELNRPIDTEELNDLFDDAIPLEQIGKMGTVKVYNQAYVDKLQSQLTEKDKQIEELETRCNELFFQVNEQVEQIEKMKSDINQLRENRMNDDTDQNIIDRLWKEWDVLIGVSN